MPGQADIYRYAWRQDDDDGATSRHVKEKDDAPSSGHRRYASHALRRVDGDDDFAVTKALLSRFRILSTLTTRRGALTEQARRSAASNNIYEANEATRVIDTLR